MVGFPWLNGLRERLSGKARRRVNTTDGRLASRNARDIQKLEDRTVLSATVQFTGAGLLRILADANESISVGEDSTLSGQLDVRVDGVSATNLPTGLATGAVTSIEIIAGAGDNVIDLSGVNAAAFGGLTGATSTISITGGQGDDLITAAADLPTVVDAGDGSDTLNGGAAADVLNGRNGADSISGSGGDDTIDAGNGDDSVDAGDGNDNVTAGDGHDTVDAGAGDDILVGGDGHDSLIGGAGLDTVNGNGGRDTIDGGTDADTLFGGGADDSVDGGDGDDLLHGNGGNDFLRGQGGADSIQGQNGRDTIDGGTGDDQLNGGAGADSVAGGSDDDNILGGGGNDTLLGEDFVLESGAVGNDSIRGQAGDDTLLGGVGQDTLDGGSGDDLVQSGDELGTVPIQISINDVFSGIESDGVSIDFGPGTSVSTGTNAFFVEDIEVGDLDNDGDLDIVSAGSNDLSVLINNGAGGFSATSFVLPTFSTVTIELDDLNGDGFLDITTGAHTTGNIVVGLFNNGDGTFADPIDLAPALNDHTFGHASGDFDGDGDIDIAALLHFQSEVRILTNDGLGNFTDGGLQTVATQSFINEIIQSADLNNDGIDDLIVADDFFGNGVDIALGAGGGGFGGATNVPLMMGADPRDFRTGDLDGDGDIDIAVLTDADTVEILTNAGGGTFTSTQSIMLPGTFTVFSEGITLDDFDGDGALDIAVIDTGDPLVVMINDGAGNFGNILQFPTNPTIGNDDALASGDFDGDGNVDLVAPGSFFFTTSNLLLLFNNPAPPPVLTFTVRLSRPSTTTVTVDYATASGSAISGGDFTEASGRVTFAPGEVSQTIDVSALGDLTPEQDETFSVILTNPIGGELSDAIGQGVINDDDAFTGGNLPTLSISDVQISPEGGSGTTTTAIFNVTLSASQTSPVTVDFQTGDVTARGDVDYVSSSGTVTFPAGSTSQQVTITVIGDNLPEVEETFSVNLLNPMGAILLDSRGEGTIVNDDDSTIVFAGDTLRGSGGRDTLLGSVGDDFFSAGGGRDRVEGRDGNDTLLGGGGVDTLLGGNGDDEIDGQGGNDLADGEAGQDTLIWSGLGDGDDTLTGGLGQDQVQVDGSSAANTLVVDQSSTGEVTVSEGTASVTIDETIRIILVNGNNGADSISVGDISDAGRIWLIVDGGIGDDTIDASAARLGSARVELRGNVGADTILGSSQAEIVEGGDGNDSIVASGGDDTVDGDAGADIVDAGAGNDVVRGGADDDTLSGGDGDDTLDGGLDSDVLTGGDGLDSLSGSEGDDNLNGNGGNDTLLGGTGQDTLSGGSGNDNLDGGRNNDRINGQGGNDSILGGHGDDSITGGAGDDEILGGDGDDTINAGSGRDGVDGGNGSDLIDGGTGKDVLRGDDGDDTLRGGGGGDTLLGDQGTDVLIGNGGNDLGQRGEGNDPAPTSVETIDEQFTLTAKLLARLDAM